MLDINTNLFDAFKPFEEKVDSNLMWNQYEAMREEATGFKMRTGPYYEDMCYTTSSWYGEGLPVLPCYEAMWEKDGNIGWDCLFLTRKQYELYTLWLENNVVYGKAFPEGFDRYHTDNAHYFDEIFVFDPENGSELILRKDDE